MSDGQWLLLLAVVFVIGLAIEGAAGRRAARRQRAAPDADRPRWAVWWLTGWPGGWYRASLGLRVLDIAVVSVGVCLAAAALSWWGGGTVDWGRATRAGLLWAVVRSLLGLVVWPLCRRRRAP